MRHRNFLIGTTALALLAGSSMALAQGIAPREPSAPAVTQHPGNMERGKAGNAQHEGQGALPSRAQSERGKGNSDQTTGQAPTTNQAQPQHNQSGRDASGQQPQRSQQNAGQSERGAAGKRDRDETTGQQPQQQNQAQPKQQNQAQPQQQNQAQPQQGQNNQRRQGTDQTQGQAGARVTLSTEQRTRLREVIHSSGNAPRATNVNFTITVGTVVPRTVRLAPLPTLIVDVEPTWRGYMYFLVGDEIIVVEPRTLKIVAVIEV